MIKIAFYDDREPSNTYRRLNDLMFSNARPTLIGTRGVWHALKNVGTDEAAYVTMKDRAFNYEGPDDWRLPVGASEAPF
jgi:dTDP-4-dehydrorhamnose 3,5-epimerase